MNPKQILINALLALGFVEGKTLFLQGTINPDDPYPDSFVTFYTNPSADKSHYNNAVHSVEWDFSVFYYSNNPTLVNTKPFEIMAALRKAGFIPQGRGQDIVSDEPSHTGWVVDYLYTEIL